MDNSISKEHLKGRVVDIVKKEVDADLSVIDPDRDIREQVNIDSMQLIAIYAAVVDEFNIEIPLSIMASRTLNEILDNLSREVIGGA